MHILLTNDDGITSRGLFEAKLALERHGTVSVIAPDSNRSGSARSITIDRPLTVAEVTLRDGSTGFATDGTPVDCVRFGELGLVGERPDLIVSGINYGYNLGDDVTYSGTVAAAFEGILLGIQGIAISQGAPTASGSDFRRHEDYDFGPAADFLGELVGRVIGHGLPDGTVLNVNVPSQPDGVAVGRLGDDVTYSGTVAAAFEGILLGIQGIAISQGAPTASGSDFRRHEDYDFGPAADFLGELVGRVIEHGLPDGTVLNVNVPSQPDGVAVGRLGKRIYADTLEQEADAVGHRRYRIYGDEPSYHDEPGTDFRAIAEGKIAITPIHLDLTSTSGLEALGRWSL